ncbi:uncharacterized protein LOC132163877 [Corylus avellana]|uniref:uncharacterized protein LOC132163877 n=1 Tax=Corylus avellana TaxID=13451 RepID=UPI001E22E5C2|nr:uncharacterized protein LOC132163877 [Corylus avellana]
MESPNDFSYASEPTSPSRCSLESKMYFYSVPTSPTCRGVSASFGFETEPPSPRTYEDATSSFGDDFEFETSRRFSVESGQNFENPFDHQQQQVQRGNSLPTAMAFADELFCDGKVLPLAPPLKLPPRLRNVNNKSSNQSSAASSPRSPSSVINKLSFSRRSLWNDDFDPFMAALENVREEKRGKTRGDNRRQARSLSPFRATRPQQSDDSVGSSSPKLREPNSLAQVGQSPKKLEEPKGLSFARQLRLVKIDHEMPTKPSLEAGENARESAEHCISKSKSKRQKIRKFLFKSASMRELTDKNKVRDQNTASWKARFLRRFSFKPAGSAQFNGDMRVAKVTKMTLIQYRPKLLMCMGFGARYVN